MTNTEKLDINTPYGSIVTGSRTVAAVAEHLEITEPEAQSALDELVRSGQVVKAASALGRDYGKYYLPFGPDKEVVRRHGVVVAVKDKGTRGLIRGD